MIDFLAGNAQAPQKFLDLLVGIHETHPSRARFCPIVM
jgi:hypothetical protein